MMKITENNPVESKKHENYYSIYFELIFRRHWIHILLNIEEHKMVLGGHMDNVVNEK